MDKNVKNGVHSVSNQLKHEWEKVPFLMDTVEDNQRVTYTNTVSADVIGLLYSVLTRQPSSVACLHKQ
jgi:hypothetical protein